MKKYLLDVCGDINDGDYVHNISVIDEKELNCVEEMLISIKKAREAYKEYNPNAYLDYCDKLPYFGETWDNLENLSEIISKKDIINFEAFYHSYCPNCIVDDSVHSINYIRIYELANDKYISLL